MFDFENKNYVPLAEPDPSRLQLGRIVIATATGGFFDTDASIADWLHSDAPEDVAGGLVATIQDESLLLELTLECDEAVACLLTAGLAVQVARQSKYTDLSKVSYKRGCVISAARLAGDMKRGRTRGLADYEQPGLAKVFEQLKAFALADENLLNKKTYAPALSRVHQLKPRLRPALHTQRSRVAQHDSAAA